MRYFLAYCFNKGFRSSCSQNITPVLLGKAPGEAIASEKPKAPLSGSTAVLSRFACKKREDFLPAIHEFRTVSPLEVRRVGQTYSFSITRIQGIFSRPNRGRKV